MEIEGPEVERCVSGHRQSYSSSSAKAMRCVCVCATQSHSLDFQVEPALRKSTNFTCAVVVYTSCVEVLHHELMLLLNFSEKAI